MILTFLIVISVVAGFIATFYIFTKHIYKLEILVKAKDIYEAKVITDPAKEAGYVVPLDRPETLSDAILDKDPESIRQMFSQPS